jgi:hypothetical protein
MWILQNAGGSDDDAMTFRRLTAADETVARAPAPPVLVGLVAAMGIDLFWSIPPRRRGGPCGPRTT